VSGDAQLDGLIAKLFAIVNIVLAAWMIARMSD